MFPSLKQRQPLAGVMISLKEKANCGEGFENRRLQNKCLLKSSKGKVLCSGESSPSRLFFLFVF